MPDTFNFDPSKPLSMPKTGVTMGQNLDTRLVSQFDPNKASVGAWYGDKNNFLTIDPFKDSRVTAKPYSNVTRDWSKIDPFGAAQTDSQKDWLTAGWGADAMPLTLEGVQGTQDFLSANPQLTAFLKNMGVNVGTQRAPTTTALGESIPGITGPSVFFDRGTGQLVAQLQDFDEAAYLAANPDVQAAIDAGVLDSGREHYFTWGQGEGRSLGLPETAAAAPDPFASPNDAAGALLTMPGNFYDASRLDTQRFFNAAGDLSETFKQQLDVLMDAVAGAPNGTPPTAAPTTQAPQPAAPTAAPGVGSPEWTQAYLAARPDVAAAIQAGAFPDALTHWNQYGQREAAGLPANDPYSYGYTGGEEVLYQPPGATDVGGAGAAAADGGAANNLTDPLSVIVDYAMGGAPNGFNPKSLFAGAGAGGTIAAGIANPALYGSMLTGGPVLPNPVGLISIANMINGMFEKNPGNTWNATIGADGTVRNDGAFKPAFEEGEFDPTAAFGQAVNAGLQKALKDAGLSLDLNVSGQAPSLAFDYRYGGDEDYGTPVGWNAYLRDYYNPTNPNWSIGGIKNTGDLYAQTINMLRDLGLTRALA